MENIEIMNEGVETVLEDVAAEKTPGIGIGGKLLIGVGLALAVTAGIKLAKKAYAAHKAKKELTLVEAESEDTTENED